MIRFDRSRVAVAGTVVAVATVLSAGVFAQSSPGPGRPGFGAPIRPGGPMMGLGLLLGRLNLTDAQRTQVRRVMDRHQEEMRATQIRMGEARDALRKAVETVPLDEGLVREKADAVGRVEGDLAVVRARIHSEVYALLTAEQQTTAAQITAEREARMRQRQEQLRQQRQQRQQRPQS